MTFSELKGISIGDSIIGGTEGSVLFLGASGVLAQDNTNFFWDDTNNRLGIGRNTPVTDLDIYHTGGNDGYNGILVQTTNKAIWSALVFGVNNNDVQTDWSAGIWQGGSDYNDYGRPLALEIYNGLNASIVFHTNAIAQMQLTNTGNLTFAAGTQEIAGIENQNLLDKTASENITGVYQFDAAPIIDVTSTEALLVRKDADARDVFTVDTTNEDIIVGNGALSGDRTIEFYNENTLFASFGFDDTAVEMKLSVDAFDSADIQTWTASQVNILQDIDFAEGMSVDIETVTSATVNLADDDYIVLCDASSNAITVNLPAIASHEGRVYHIKKIDSSANAVTVDGNSSETIDGATTAVITAQYESIKIGATSSGWHII